MWLKIMDSLPDHPRVAEAIPEAMWLYVAGLCYCNRLETDGRIPKSQVGRLTTLPKPERLKASLVEVGLWIDHDNHVEVWNYLKFNRSAAEMEAARQRAASAGRSGGLAKSQRSAKQPASKSPSESLTDRQADGLAEKNREEKRREEPKKLSSVPPESDAPTFEEFWAEYPAQQNGSKPEKKLAHDQWAKLKFPERQRAFDSLKHYKTHLKQTEQFSKHAFRYLRDRSFEDRLASAGANGTPHDPEAEARRLVASAGF
jgi:hypothetical protein